MILSGKSSLLLLFILICNIAGSQNLFNAENSKKFARYLESTRQYKLAAVEYERILSIEKTDPAIYTGLLKNYRLGNICENSFQNLNQLQINTFFSNQNVAAEYLKLSLSCNCCYEENYFSDALSSVSNREKTFYKLGYYLFTEQKDSLSRFTYNNLSLLSNSYPTVLNKIENIESFKRKSPGLAMAMSAVIPGSGKAYSGYWGDAVMSLVFVSTNAWLSYRGFSKKGVKNANGWIFGGISLGFYLGNIWGSGKSARTYNQIEYEKLYNEAKNSIYSHF